MNITTCNIYDYRYNGIVDKIFKVFADQNRRKIITILRNGESDVNSILKFLSIRQATLSSHLSILRKSGLVTFTIKGKSRIYRLNDDVLNNFVSELYKFAKIDKQNIEDEIILRRKL